MRRALVWLNLYGCEAVWHKLKNTKNAFFVITSKPIEVQTRSAPQNDGLNLIFVKDVYVDGKKLAKNGRKTTIYMYL